ncbi:MULTISPECIES: Arc domain-containing protein [Pseudomonas syringae group]|uniref:Arc domain-containing protein n=1 Tax=Pseudomonas syringae group TaxID=136849 RepID=UPI0002E282A6|nr:MULTISPECIES: Arc domain-containing protein [Pseudomonas syringae group]MBM1212545.1 Arc domain-containing protein [Pseudomonas syringae]MBM1218285.1 Arc domain-containing protein [Pseudomonas syringae]MBX6404068.1 Arc domain-containing protein [Pseudomonas syringae pv. tomato]MBX6408177.1 Arc domain-containing protein [Pseudomonas syringae pv. tomato]MBX6432858.1 Arc domain-containing protein [Pseudomonas syringae pv. tomato]
MARSDAQLKLRLPCSHKAWVEEKAKEEFHSMQAVVLRLIDEAKKKDEEIKRA